MNSVLVKIWVGVLLVAVGAYGTFTVLRKSGYFATEAKPEEEPPQVVELKPGAQPLPELADVKLIERSGANFRWSQLKGQPWVANVFYTQCKKECTFLSYQIRGLQNDLPGVRFVSITCDPDDDTPEKLRQYADDFTADPARWYFVTGDMRDIKRASKAIFGFALAREEHAPYLALMDGESRFVGMYDGLSRQSIAELEAKVKELQTPKPEQGKPDQAKPEQPTSPDGKTAAADAVPDKQ
ncbi:MAG: SCO family protein [Pirellulales bacterium]